MSESRTIFEKNLIEKPDLFRSPFGNATTDKTDQNRLVGSSLIPILKRIHDIVAISAQYDTVKIRHGLGSIYEFYGRYRPVGEKEKWYMFPTTTERLDNTITPASIDNNYIYINFDIPPEQNKYEFELFFIEFGL